MKTTTTKPSNKPYVHKVRCRSNEEWREVRSHSVGASAIGTILGLNRFEGPLRLAAKMRAELRGEFDWTQNLAMMRGHAYEGGVARLFEQFDGRVEIIDASAAEYVVMREDMPWMHASPDRMFWLDRSGAKYGKESELNKGVLECKTTQSAVDTRRFSQCWYLQLQQQLGICGKQKGVIAWDVLSSKEGFGYHYFDFNPDVFDAIAAVNKDFWERVVIGGDDPAPARVIRKNYPMLYKEVSFERVELSKDSTRLQQSRKECKTDSLFPFFSRFRERALRCEQTTHEEEFHLPEPDDDDDDTGRQKKTTSSWLSNLWK